MVSHGLHTFYILEVPITNAITGNNHWTMVLEVKPIQSGLRWRLTVSIKNAKIGLFMFEMYKFSTLWRFDKNHDLKRRVDAEH